MYFFKQNGRKINSQLLLKVSVKVNSLFQKATLAYRVKINKLISYIDL